MLAKTKERKTRLRALDEELRRYTFPRCAKS